MTQENSDIHFNMSKRFPLNSVKENNCPACLLKKCEGSDCCIIKADSSEKCKTAVRIMGEEEVDELIWHDGTMKTLESAGKDDEKRLTNAKEIANKNESDEAVREGRSPNYEKIIIPDVKIPVRKILTEEEKQSMKQQIRDDIVKFSFYGFVL